MCIGMRMSATDKRHSSGTNASSTALPLGVAASDARARWYFVHCPEGKERSLCKNLVRTISPSILRDAFVLRKECEIQASDGWRKTVATVFPEYLVAVTGDPFALQQQILTHTFPVYVAGKVGDGYAPVAQEAQEFLASVMDDTHIVRLSTAVASGRTLRIATGPLVGHEDRITAYDKNGRTVRVAVCRGLDGTEPFSLDLSVQLQPSSHQPERASWTSVTAKRLNPSLPMSHRTPKGTLRWYLVECPEGQEERMCRAVREATPAAVLADAFVPRTEVVKKVHGEWTKPVRQIFAGRFAVATDNAAALNARLQRMGLPVRLACDTNGHYAPVDAEAWEFLESCMDGTRTIRESQGEIVGDQLHVWSGPLAGKESRVTSYVRRKSLAFVDLSTDQTGEHTLALPLAILARR